MTSATPPNPATRHDTVMLTRRFAAPPAEVFALFADTARWRRWFRMPGTNASYEHDFRRGGGDVATSEFTHPDGRRERLANRSTYLAIEQDRRLLYAYESRVDEQPRWASLVTVELTGDGDGTLLTWTEQVAFLTLTGNGTEDLAHLRGALRLRMNALDVALGS